MRRRPVLHGMMAVTAALIWFSSGSVATAQQDQGGSAAPRLPPGVGPGREPVPIGYAGTIRVPQDFDTIQAAVDHAKPGGMVLVAPGVYRESVTVTTPYLTIRGLDRSRTIVDGGSERAGGVQVFAADGVAIENLTSRNNLDDGFSWHGVHGYWGRYLTAYDNGGSGIAAYGSDDGQLDHSLASGSPHRTARSALPSATCSSPETTSTTTATSPHRRSRSPTRRSGWASSWPAAWTTWSRGT